MKKKIMMGFIIITIFFTCSIPTVCKAEGEDENDGSWVSEAIEAAYNFLNEDITVDDEGIVYSLYTFFTNIVKAINRVLLVLLAGLSIVSLSIVGIRYIMCGALPSERRKAQEQLKAVFKGMMYGFGAFIIWNIAMSVVRVILSAMS